MTQQKSGLTVSSPFWYSPLPLRISGRQSEGSFGNVTPIMVDIIETITVGIIEIMGDLPTGTVKAYFLEIPFLR